MKKLLLLSILIVSFGLSMPSPIKADMVGPTGVKTIGAVSVLVGLGCYASFAALFHWALQEKPRTYEGRGGYVTRVGLPVLAVGTYALAGGAFTLYTGDLSYMNLAKDFERIGAFARALIAKLESYTTTTTTTTESVTYQHS